MQNDIIDMIEPTPTLHSKKCRIISFSLRVFLQYGIFLIALITFYFYNTFVAIATFLVCYIVMGIVRSKIRNSTIPFKQREYHYSDKGIADWYIAKEICNDDLETKLELI